jgi:long-chain acyl-CoA synthetase
MKVRRGLIDERYGALVSALYDGSTVVDAATEVTFEDGRKGTISGRIKIRDMKVYPAESATQALEKAA